MKKLFLLLTLFTGLFFGNSHAETDWVYSTLLGGDLADEGLAIAVDAQGHLYVTGRTQSTLFPTPKGRSSDKHGIDAYIAKFSPDGDQLLYLLWFNALNASDIDEAFGIAVDDTGSAYVTGHTRSADFCTLFGTAPGYDSSYNNNGDAFVLKVKPDGSGLDYCTFIGGSDWDLGTAVLVDSHHNAYITGGTWSTDLPTTPNAYSRSHSGLRDTFVAKLDASGTQLAFATYLGGSNQEEAVDLAQDDAGNLYVAGWTRSDDFPTTPNSYRPSFGGNFDGFLYQLTPDASTLTYSSYVGGSDEDRVTGLAVSSNGQITLGGHTRSADGWGETAVLQGERDLFALRLQPNGTVGWQTLLGGSDEEEVTGLALGAFGSVYLTGTTWSDDFATASQLQGTQDSFIVQLDAQGNPLTQSYLGGSQEERGGDILATGSHLYLTGSSRSADFPTTANAYSSKLNGDYDIFAAKQALPAPRQQIYLPLMLSAPAQEEKEEGGITAVMQAYLADHQPTQPLQELAATPCTAGLAATYPCQNIDLLAFLPLANIGGGSGNDIWGWTDPQTSKEYAIMGRNSGTSFVDISDPENPVYLGNLPTHTSNSSWRDIKVYNNHAFIVSEASGHGMQIFDLTRLRNVTSPPATFNNDAHFGNFGNAHNIVINEQSGYAYAVGASTCSGGLHMIDISNPTSPTDAGCFSSDGYTHDAQCVIYNGPDLAHIGQEICFNSNEDTLTIVDVTDKNNPRQLSRTGYSGSRYTHQGWLSEDQTRFFLDDELDERNNGHNTRTYVWDISDLDTPTQTNLFTSANPAIDHNQYVKGSLSYQSNYRAGLRILDVATPNALSEVAYFDVYPSNNAAEFNGTWSNYPYFESDIVIVSGIEQGLFVLQPTNLTADFTLSPSAVTLDICGANSAATTFTLNDIYGFNSNVTLAVSGIPSGASGSFSSNPVTVPNTTTLTVSNSTAASGDHLLTVTATGGNRSYQEYLKLSILDLVASSPTLTTPAANAVDVATTPTLAWTAVANATHYDLQIATDAAFSNIIETATNLSSPSYTPSQLSETTTYHWRVRAKNPCNSSSYSSSQPFTTAAMSCTTYDNNSPVNISSSGTPSITSDLSVTSSGAIYDLNLLNLDITHTWVNDLSISLRSPTGSTVELMARSCSSENNININLDDQAAAGNWPCPPDDGGTYQPSNPLDTFASEESNGNWQLTVQDHANQDGGSLNGWSLEVCTICPTPTAVSQLTLTLLDSNNTTRLSWSDTGADEYEIWQHSNNPYASPSGSCADNPTLCTTIPNPAGSGDISYDNPNSWGNGSNKTYTIVARNSCGRAASSFATQALFEFGLVPGSP